MSEVRLPAETRTEFGKGGARRTRRAGKVPAVIYGHGDDPRHVALPARELANAIRHGGANVLLTLEVDGGEQLAIPKAIQRHPIKGYFEHVDLLAVRLGEKVTIDVPITVVGDAAPGALINLENTTVNVEAEATHLPTGFEIDITGREIGSQITAADITLPAGTTLAGDAEMLILSISEAPTEIDLEAEGEPTGDAVETAGVAHGAGETGSDTVDNSADASTDQ